MSRHANPRIATETDLAAAERVAELAGIAGRRGVITSTCLRQSLVVHAILRKRGLKPELKLGVRKRDGAVDAHAWVEVGSQALNSNALGADGFRSLQRPAEPNSSQRA